MGLMVCIGFILGAGGFFLSRWMIRKRSDKVSFAGNKLLGRSWGWLVWGAAGALASGLAAWSSGIPRAIELAVVLMILACLSTVDGLIRKIPNELLAALLVFRSVLIIVDGDGGSFKTALIGFAAGFMLFQVPAMLGISIGWGDVKYAGAAGFYLGLAGLFQAILIMAIGMGLYGIYLKITKKGNLKTRVPMGPYLSLGMMLAILFPIVNEAAKTILPGGF